MSNFGTDERITDSSDSFLCTEMLGEKKLAAVLHAGVCILEIS